MFKIFISFWGKYNKKIIDTSIILICLSVAGIFFIMRDIKYIRPISKLKSNPINRKLQIEIDNKKSLNILKTKNINYLPLLENIKVNLLNYNSMQDVIIKTKFLEEIKLSETKKVPMKKYQILITQSINNQLPANTSNLTVSILDHVYYLTIAGIIKDGGKYIVLSKELALEISKEMDNNKYVMLVNNYDDINKIVGNYSAKGFLISQTNDNQNREISMLEKAKSYYDLFIFFILLLDFCMYYIYIKCIYTTRKKEILLLNALGYTINSITLLFYFYIFLVFVCSYLILIFCIMIIDLKYHINSVESICSYYTFAIMLAIHYLTYHFTKYNLKKIIRS